MIPIAADFSVGTGAFGVVTEGQRLVGLTMPAALDPGTDTWDGFADAIRTRGFERIAGNGLSSGSVSCRGHRAAGESTISDPMLFGGEGRMHGERTCIVRPGR